MKLVEVLKSERIHYFWSGIDAVSSGKAFISLNNWIKNPSSKQIATLFINSPGGTLSDTWALVDLIENSGMEIRTVGMGMISSAALLLLMAGTRGQRFALPRTFFMSHHFRWPFAERPDYLELKERRIAEDFIFQSMERYFITHSKLNRRTVNRFLNSQDKYFEAKEALEAGFIDEIIK